MRYLASLFSTFFFLLSPTLARAESVSVSLQVGSTQVTFAGYTSPNTFISIKEDGSVVGTTTSDSSGNWTKTITVATPTLHTYTLSASDASSRTTATISYNLNVVSNTTTSVNNIVLPPTTALSGTALVGSSYPGATITITFSSGDTNSLTVPSSGNWSYSLSGRSGASTITATATVGSYLSLASTSLTYNGPTPTPSATAAPSSSPQSSQSSPSPSISASPSRSPSPVPFFLPLYDPSGDGRLSLSELFDVITAWLKQHLPCDLNRDQQCNLIDLSILLYYIER